MILSSIILHLPNSGCFSSQLTQVIISKAKRNSNAGKKTRIINIGYTLITTCV